MVASRVRIMRLWLRLTQSEVASVLGISAGGLATRELGKRKIMAHEIMKLAEFFKCDPSVLLGMKPLPFGAAEEKSK